MEKKLEIGYYKYTIDQLPAADRELVAEAQAALKKAYPKYSGFSVGAAVRLKSGKILHGANSESEVFPSGICAERSVLYYAEAIHSDDPVEALAIISDPSERECYPCGACRQVMQELGPQMEVLLINRQGKQIITSVAELLPYSFQDFPQTETPAKGDM